MSIGKRIIQNTMLLSGQQFFMQVVALFVVGYLASIIGLEDYGMFLFSLSFISIFGILANLGTRTYVTREMAADRRGAAELFSDILPLRMCLALLASLAALCAIYVLPYSDKEILLVEIAIFSQLCAWVYANTFMVYEAFEMMAYPVTIDLVIRIFVLVSAVVSVNMGYGVIGLATCYAIGNFVEIFFAYFFLHKRFFSPKYIFFPFRISQNVKFLKLSFPYCFIGVFNLLISSSDTIMLSLFQGPAAVGLYGVASTIYIRLAGLVDALSTAFFPVIIRLRKKLDPETFKNKMTLAFQFLIVIMVPVAFGVFLVAGDIVGIVYKNSDFFPASFTLKIIICSLPFNALSFVFGYSLIADDKQYLLVKINSFILIFNLILNLILINLYSYNGVAIATAISLLTKLILLSLASHKIVCWSSVNRCAALVLLSSMLMSTVVIYIKTIDLFLSIVFGVLIYSLLIILFRAVDIRRIYTMIRSK